MLTPTRSVTSIGVFENFVQALWSSVLSDLGVTSPLNILVNRTLITQVIHPNLDVPKGITLTWINGTAADYVLANMEKFNLPFEPLSSVPFNARYLCHTMWWKPPTSLAVDVLVATTSLFMVFWAALQLALRYFATNASPTGELVYQGRNA